MGKNREICTVCSELQILYHNRSGSGRFSRVGPLVVCESRERRDEIEKNASFSLAWHFPFLRAESLVVRQSRHSRDRRDKIFDKKEPKTKQKYCLNSIRNPIFFAETKQKQQFSMGNFHFFGRRKINFWGRGGITSKLASHSVHPGAYTSMP